jgi:hypothetical protein
MIDIIFIVLLFLVFLVGANNYENFESIMAQEDELYQSNQVTALTEGLDENITGTLTGITNMVGDITGEIDKLTEKKKWIDGCVSYVQHCGKEPYWCNGCCKGSGYDCNHRCSRRDSLGVCTEVSHDTCYPDIDCWKWRSNCTDKYPLWKCSPKPSGYSTPPGFPSGWRR